MKIILIIQARMGSSRLPNKVLLPLGYSHILDFVVARCRMDPRISEVIIATSSLEQDNSIAEWCLKHDVTCFRGSETDVLDRYYQCAKASNPDYVIRVTSDCPFIDYKIISGILDKVEQFPCDLVTMDGELPRGFWSEIVSFSALAYIHANGQEPRHREHVTYYAYEFPGQFTTVPYSIPEEMWHPELRITLDTHDDYELLKQIADHFVGDKLITSQQIISYLLANPDIAGINAHIQQKPIV